MRLFILSIFAFLLCSCSTSKVTGVTDEPQTVVLPAKCETTEAARFHRDEEVLLVYKGQKTETIKEELKCMMLKGIGDGMRRNHLVGSNKPFGVSTFDIESKTITRYFVSPLRGLFFVESVTPTKDENTFAVARRIFFARPHDIAVVMGAEGMFNLPIVGGGDGLISKEQVYFVLGTYFHGGNIQPPQPQPENKKEEDAK